MEVEHFDQVSSGQTERSELGSDLESLMSISDQEESSSDRSDSDEDFSALREEALNQLDMDCNADENAEGEEVEGSQRQVFPPDFMTIYERMTEPKTMGGVVDLSDSDSEEDWGSEESSEAKCSVLSCNSRKRVKLRSRLVTSFFGLNYVESPLICHKCFIKACKFYRKIASIGPDKCKFLVNDNICKNYDFIDISEDGPVPQGPVELFDDDSLTTEVCKNVHIHLDNVAQRYHLEERINRLLHKTENKIGKMTVWINELNCKLDMDDGSLVKLLQDIYSTFTPPLTQDEDIDMDIVDADNPEISKQWQSNSDRMSIPTAQAKKDHPPDKSTIVIDSFSDPDIAIVEDSVPASLKKPSDLPSRGVIVRKKPSIGQKVFVSRQADLNDWIPATVQSIIIKEREDHYLKYSYKVQVCSGPYTELDYVKEVDESQMAYFEPSPVRIAVGNRVISAIHGDNSLPLKYYSGVVAESPSSNNRYRYMIMFECMAVQYSKHEDLRVTVCDVKENIHQFFPVAFQPFIRKYFELLPKRRILNVNTMDTIKVEYHDKWVDANVTAVDGLLIEVYFKAGQPTEWIYRGSPRVMSKEMYRMKLIKAFSDGAIKPVARGGVLAEDDPVEVSKVIEMLNARAGVQRPGGVSSGELVRAVAKKTVTRAPEPVQTVALARTNSIYQSRNSSKDEFAGAVKAVRDLGIPILFPKDLGEHECSEECLLWTRRTMDMCRGMNPLVIPMLFAFRRVDVTPIGGGAKQIYYDSPCGRKLEDFDQLLAYLQVTKCQLSVDYFNFDSWVSVWDEFKAAPRGLLLKDLSYGKEFNMIPVVNTVDKELPPYMNYEVSRIATEGVPLNLDSEFLTCCDCTDDCSNKMKCPCWQRTMKDYLDLIVKTNREIDSSTNLMDYSYIGYQNKRLVEYVPSGIYECNSMCKCSHTCLNRVVQLPLKVKLELFKTKYKGWGTRCLNDIPAGGFICVYVGNLLTEKAANEEGKTYGDEYFAELDYIEVMERLMNKPGYESGPEDLETSDEEEESGLDDSAEGPALNPSINLRARKKDKDKKNRIKRSTTDTSQLRKVGVVKTQGAGTTHQDPGVKDEETTPQHQPHNAYLPLRSLYGNNETVYIIDAKSAGNIGRYFNHSCEPNIFVQNVFVDTHDLRFPWVAFFAKQHIRAGSELTWDYQYMVDSVPGKKLYCYCGSKTCRGRLL